MDYFKLLPDELITTIILECSYATIINIQPVCKRINNIISSQNLLKGRFNIGFPRIEGKCKIHNIPDKITKLRSYDPRSELTEHMIFKALKHMIDTEENVINGDIFSFDISHCGLTGPHPPIVATFYDLELTVLNSFQPIISSNCHVIENNVPLNYWYIEFNRWDHMSKRIWFDHKLVRQQCIDNIKYGPIYDNLPSRASATFSYNNINYNIVYLRSNIKNKKDVFLDFIDNDDSLKHISELKNLLLSDEPILFYQDICINFKDSNTLFIHS